MKIRTVSLLVIASLFALLLLLVSGVYWVLATERGAQYSLRALQSQLPELKIVNASGSWIDGLSIDAVDWNADTAIHLTEVKLRLIWLHLLHGEVRLSMLHADELRLVLSESDDTNEPIKLPSIFLPIFLSTPDLALQKLAIVSTDSEFLLNDLRTAIVWRGARLRATGLHLRWNEMQLDTSGTLDFRNDYPLALKGALRVPQWATPIAVQTGGDLRSLQIQATTDQPYAVQAKVTLATLDEHLPLSAVVTLLRPITQPIPNGSIDVAVATLNARGNLLHIDGELKATVNETHVGATQLALTAQWQPEQLLAQARWQVQNGTLQIDCTAALTKPLSGACNGAATAIPLTPWLQGQTGEFSSAIKLEGKWFDPQWALALELPTFSGQLGGDEITGRLALNTADGEQWQLQQLALASGPNKLSGSGEFGERYRLHFSIGARDMAHLHPQLGGTLSAEIDGGGTWPELDVRGNARGSKLRYQNVQLAQANIDLMLAKLGNAGSRIQLDTKKITIDDGIPFDLTLSVSGERAQQRIDIAAQQRMHRAAVQCATQNSAEFNDWKIECANIQGSVRSEHYTSNWRNTSTVRAQVKVAERQFELSPFCLRAEGDAELCLDQKLHYANAKLQPFAAHGRLLPLRWVDAWLPENLALEDDPRASLQMRLQSIAPLRAQANLLIAGTRWQWQTPLATHTAEINNIHLDAELNEQRALITAGAASPTLGSVDATLTVQDPRNQRVLNGNVALERLELAGFAWLIEDLDALSGQINGNVGISGTAAAPQLTGKLFLQNGSATWAPLGAPFRTINADLTFNNNSAKLGGWFALGQGGGDIDGNASWDANGDNWQARVGIVAGGVSAIPLPNSSVVFSPHAELTAKPGEVHINGYVDIASADIQLKQLPPNTTDVSQDAEIVGQRIDEEMKLWVDLGLNLGDKFHFAGFGADVNLSGRLQLEKNPGDNLHMIGEVKVPRGRYRAYGQRLVVRKGSFIFYGPPDNPDLNLEAVREMSLGVTDVVGLRVIGSLKTPEALLFSEPSMPDSDIAYYLLTGRKPISGGTTGGFTASGALLSLGLAGSEDRAGNLAKRFGISDLQLGTTETQTGTEAEVSGQLGENLSVRYGRGIGQSSNSISFQYRLTPKLMIETISGVENALDFLYSFEIK